MVRVVRVQERRRTLVELRPVATPSAATPWPPVTDAAPGPVSVPDAAPAPAPDAAPASVSSPAPVADATLGVDAHTVVSPSEVAEVAEEERSSLRRTILATDLLALAITWGAVAAMLHVVDAPAWTTSLAVGGLTLGLGPLLIVAAGLYRRRIAQVRSTELARTAAIAGVLTVLLAHLTYTGGVSQLDAALVAAVGGGATLLTLGVSRALVREWLGGRRAAGEHQNPVIVLGGTDGIHRTVSFLHRHPHLGFEVRGTMSPAEPVEVTEHDRLWLGPTGDVLDAARRVGARGVVIDDAGLDATEMDQLVRELTAAGIHVHVVAGVRGLDPRRLSVEWVADEAFLSVRPLQLSRRQAVLKRILDVSVAVVMLSVSAPVLVVAAIAIRLESRGPVLFRQKRVGIDGELFTLWKLRTMVVDAEDRLADLAESNDRDGPLFKSAADPRITRVGRLLRATSLDELPQLVQVLEGTMSLVGPRPALVDEVSTFDTELRQRTDVKPGLTGMWQVSARDTDSFELYRRFDLMYVRNWTLGLDLRILVRTASSVLSRAIHVLIGRGGVGA